MPVARSPAATAAAVVVVAVLAVAGWTVGTRWLVRRRKDELTRAAAAIGGWIGQAERQGAEVRAETYGEFEQLLVRERPLFVRDATRLGPGILGSTVRIRLCIDAFRAALARPARAATHHDMAREMVHQIELAIADLRRQLSPVQRRAR
jgi:hypothetical protein